MNIKLEKKFTNKYLDELIDAIYRNLRSKSFDKFVFDLSEVEYIGNQELLVLSALFKSFAEAKVDFKVIFIKQDIPPSKRLKRQIIEIWEVWKIWQTVPDRQSQNYFGIDPITIERFKKELNYYPKRSEIYNRYGVTPFVMLDYIHNYNEKGVQELIDPIYKLNSVIEDLLIKNQCYHPFTSNSLSTIITEELYLNFLDHALESSFPNFPLMAFMSISFHRKLERKTAEEIQKIKRLNFQSEWQDETINFFYDKETGEFKNHSYIEFSFLDFGKGIVNTLREHYLNENKSSKAETRDSDILRYSFKYNSSRHPIYYEKTEIEQFIPRGLFDALTIVRRYKGLLIARSNFGKILFDFSISSDIDNAFSYFGNNRLFFPGTLISLYIPAIEDTSKLDISSIKPEVVFDKVKPENKKYVNINTIVEKLRVPKENLYHNLLQELRHAIFDREEHSLVFISFEGCSIDKRIIKKTIYFLLTDYDINHRNNVVILNSPPKNIIEDIASEILSLNTALRNYKLHPLPIIELNKNKKDFDVTWLGIYDEEDKEKLNYLLYEDYTISKSDFNDPDNVAGHLNAFDEYGNVKSNFPNRTNIYQFYRVESEKLAEKQVKDLLITHDCIKDDDKNLYLGGGNYYQKAFVELENLVNDRDDWNIITKLLYGKLESEIDNFDDFKFIGITTASNKIFKSLETQNIISSDRYTSIDNYHTLENDLDESNIDPTRKYILICHVISTGFLTQRLNAHLLKLGTSIQYIGVVVSVVDPNFKPSELFLKDYGDKIFYLYQYPIAKFLRKDLHSEISSKKIIRTNPFTNIPIRLSIEQTYFNESIIFQTHVDYSEEKNEITFQNRFLDSIDEGDIQIGFLKFNNVIHPYFFKTEQILRKIQEDLLKDIFEKINNFGFNKHKVQVFYPRKSGIDSFDFGQLKSVLKNQNIEEIEIERFETPEGWRFPHNTDYLSAKIENSFCFILDDGSCSGASLIQMIDEICFYDAKEIVLLCFIGRVNDHKRELFSRLSSIKVKNNKPVPISVYFVCHWHIPTYYLGENPNVKETAWLTEIINLQNTPQSIKAIARSIIKAIKPKSRPVFEDYKFLPRTKDTNEIPKKELLIIREELGKVIGYRLYKESFSFFDSFFKKYEKRELSKDRYKEIELLCAVFTYEPYLYEKIIGVLPDIVEKIEDFVLVLIFSFEKINKHLTYNWRRKDIIHLFFIVFRDEKLIRLLEGEKNGIKDLVQFAEAKESDLNYLLYSLLNYFPLKEEDLSEKKYDEQIKALVAVLKESNSSSYKEFRLFYSFITTLPSRETFHVQLAQLIDNYNKQKDPEFHIEKTSFDHNISLILSKIRDSIGNLEEDNLLDKENIEVIRERWFELTNFINPILTFSISFNEFLLPFPYFRLINKVESGDSSLRKMVGMNEEIIFSIHESFNDIEKLKILEKNIVRIQSDLKFNSDFHKLISNPQSNLKNLINSLCKEIESSGRETICENLNIIEDSFTINIPQVYSDILIIKELTTNMKNHSKKSPDSKVTIECSRPNNQSVEIKIKNKVSDDEFDSSNGEGIKCLKLLSASKLFGFSYYWDREDFLFIQKLTFLIN